MHRITSDSYILPVCDSIHCLSLLLHRSLRTSHKKVPQRRGVGSDPLGGAPEGRCRDARRQEGESDAAHDTCDERRAADHAGGRCVFGGHRSRIKMMMLTSNMTGLLPLI